MISVDLRFIRLAIGVSALFCCSFSALDLYSRFNARGAGGPLARGSSRLPVTSGLLKGFERAAVVPLAESNDLVALAEIRNELANRTFSKRRAQSLRCEAQTALVQALKREPANSTALANLAFLRNEHPVINEDIKGCEGLKGLNNVWPVELARHAAKSDPLNQEVLSTAAFVLANAGDYSEARSLSQRALALETSMPTSDPLTFLSLVGSRTELSELLPRKLSVVTQWSERIKGLDREVFPLWSAPLSQVQMETLAQLENRELTDEEISFLLRLERVVATPKVGRTVHKLLAKSVRDDRAAGFYSSLASLERLPSVPATVESSSLMRNGGLTEWNQSARVTLDRYYSAVGFFVPNPERVRAVNLRSEKTVTDSIAPLLKVFVSENNYSWTDVTSAVKVKAVPIDRHGFVSITLPAEGLPSGFGKPRFWKVYFSGSQRSGAFTGEIGEMLEVYGRVAPLPVE